MNWLVGIHSQQCRLGTYGRPGKNYGTVTDSFFFYNLRHTIKCHWFRDDMNNIILLKTTASISMLKRLKA